jgi:hypothetical protein
MPPKSNAPRINPSVMLITTALPAFISRYMPSRRILDQDQAGGSDILLSSTVDLRPHQAPRDGAHHVCDCAEDRIARPDMLEQQHAAGRPQHTQHLAQASNRIRN